MHFFVLGATGAIGTIFIDQAIAGGHQVTALVRDASKMAARFHEHMDVRIVENSLKAEDLSAVEAVLRGLPDRVLNDNSRHDKIDVFISFAGPPMARGQGRPITDTYARLLPMLQSAEVRRILVLGTPSCATTSDAPSWFWGFSRWFMNFFYPYPYNEMVGIRDLFANLPPGDFDWTLFRVGGLNDSDADKEVTATHLGSGQDRLAVSRDSVTRWVLNEALEGKWIEKSPYICN